MPHYDADVLIVGGGPSGAWAARGLALAGARVLVFDASHPREKPCGGGLTARCVALVGDVLAGVPQVAVQRVRFEAPPISRDPYPQRPRIAPAVTVGVPSSLISPAVPPLVVVSRQDFDASLLDAARRAGADVVTERVVDAGVSAEAATVRTRSRRFQGRFLIGADGAASLVRRRVHRPLPASQWSIATGVFIPDVTSLEIIVRFVSRPPGYIWSFPRTDHLAIGICAPADVTTAPELRRHLDRWLSRSGLADGRAVRPYTWPIPALTAAECLKGVPAGDRWLLAGDAAGLVDPLTREGIYYALRSGGLAAAALTGAATSPSAAYARAVNADILVELARAARARRTFFSPVVTRLWIDALRESPRVRELALRVVVGATGYERLRRQALSSLEPAAAARIARRQGLRYLRRAP